MLTEVKNKKFVVIGEETPHSEVVSLMLDVLKAMEGRIKVHLVMHWFSHEM
jgi:hypothetical protein